MNEFEEIFLAYTPVVYRFLLSLCMDRDLAEELTEETFYQAYLHIGSFRGDCKIETWLCQIAKNALRKEQRRRKRFSSPELPDTPAPDSNPFEQAADREHLLQIHRQLHALKEPYREVFQLRIFGELSFREIAEIFGKSESWAKVTFYRAKDKLIKALEGTR